MMAHHNAPYLCIGLPTWEGDYQKSTVQLMKGLSYFQEVIYVDYPKTWLDVWRRVKREGIGTLFSRKGRSNRVNTHKQAHGGKVHVLRLPPVLPTQWINSHRLYQLANGIQGWWLSWVIRRTLKRRGWAPQKGIIAFNPFYGLSLSQYLPIQDWTYYSYDNIAKAPWCEKHGPHMERQLIPQVLRVVASSEGIYQHFFGYHPNLHLVKNGVDFKQFSQASFLSPPNGRPVVGYLGSLDVRVDVDLLELCIVSHPQYDFCFVGRINHPTAEVRLGRFPNVQLVGPQPTDSLPFWVAKFSLCLIPFLKNELTRSIYPLKINEYLAAGRPVLATDFTDLSEFTRGVRVARSSAEFVSVLRDCIQNQRTETAASLSQFAAQNAWEVRALEFQEALQL